MAFLAPVHWLQSRLVVNPKSVGRSDEKMSRARILFTKLCYGASTPRGYHMDSLPLSPLEKCSSFISTSAIEKREASSPFISFEVNYLCTSTK